jgi:hypothetical protein
MNRLSKVLITCCLIFQSQLNFADTSKSFEYEKQSEEVFDLENFLKKTVIVKEEVKGTCERQVPYQENVCKDVTKYKKECNTVPAHEECKEVNDPICHTETSMENECHRLPSREQCHNETVPVCGYETRYENECNTSPSRQECRPVNEQVCRNETRYENECRTVPGENQCRVVVRYRQECSQSSGGQQCRTIPGDVQCSVVNGENRCVKIPPRQECSDSPSRNECRQVPYEERECSTGPSRQECHQVPRQERVCENQTRQDCRTVPGEYSCHQVPRQEQVCHNETQRQCDTIPGDQVCEQVPRQHQVCVDNMKKVCANVPAKEVCKNVPYKEQVCKMETKYKKEEYECMKEVEVPKETLLKTQRAAVKVEMTALSEILGPAFQVALDTKGNMSFKANANRDEDYDGSLAIGFVKKDVKAQDRGEINDITANYKVLLMDSRKSFAYLDTSALSGSLSKYSITFRLLGKVDAKRAALALKITKKDKVEIDKKISRGNISYKYNDKENFTDVSVDLKSEGAKIGSIFTGSQTVFHVELAYSQDYSDAGEMILSNIRDFTLKLSTDMVLTK